MKIVSFTENLNSFCQIMYGQSMAELEVELLGSPASDLSLLILRAPIAMALRGPLRGLTEKSL